jgi:hypothetical protein
MECVEACEALDASDPSRASADAGASFVGSGCPEPPFPCERLCWELDARFGRGRPTNLTSIDETDDTNLAAIGEPYMRCAQQRAAECRAGVSSTGGSDAGSSSATGASELSPSFGTSWTGLFLECAGLPVDFDIFD